MKQEAGLRQRAENACELCKSEQDLGVYEIPPVKADSVDHSLLVCADCLSQLNSETDLVANHWHGLKESMWSTEPAVQIVSWRMLNRLQKTGETWAQEQLDMLYLDDELMAWATADGANDEQTEPTHFDCHGDPLYAGDTVTLTKDLNVKGGGFTAKRGTAVRNISLPADDPTHIQGRVSGQQIFILTEYLKKQK